MGVCVRVCVCVCVLPILMCCSKVFLQFIVEIPYLCKTSKSESEAIQGKRKREREKRERLKTNKKRRYVERVFVRLVVLTMNVKLFATTSSLLQSC